MSTLSYRTCTLFLAVFLVPAATFAQPPNAPSNLSASTVPESPEVRFSWSAPSSGPAVTGYILVIASTPGGPGAGFQVPGHTTSFTHQFPFRANPYYARVRAVNASGESPPSNEVTFWVPCPGLSTEGFARNLSWRPIGFGQVQVVWDSREAGLSWHVGVYRAPSRTFVMDVQPDPPTRRAVTLTLDPGTYHVAIKGFNFCGGDTPVREITVVSGQVGAALVRINEFDGFVELKNVSDSTVNIGAWWLMTAAGPQNAVRVAGTIPVNTMLAPGCTFLLGPTPTVLGTPVDWMISTTGRGYAIVNGVGRMIDSAAYVDPANTTPPTPFGEGTLLPPITSGSYTRRGDQDTNDNTSDFRYLSTPTPANAAACHVETSPAPPTDLSATVVGSRVTLSWMPSTTGGIPTAYRLEAGTVPGGTNAGVFDFAAPTTLISFVGVPNGIFYARVRAMNALGVSNPSNEATITVCTGGCIPPPGAVIDLAFHISGRNVLLTWQRPASGPTPTGYVIEVGSAPGLSNYGQFATGSTAEFVSVFGVPPGTYHVRVRALNGAVLGPPSADVIIGVP